MRISDWSSDVCSSDLSYLFDDFVKCFQDAHTVIVAPIYSAGEAEIEGLCHKHLATAIKQFGHPHVLTIEESSDLAPLIETIATAGDYVMCVGAGSITTWAHQLYDQLSESSLTARYAGI